MANILIVIPHDGFRDEELEAVLNKLKKSGNEVEIGSSHHTEAKGHFGLLITPDVNVRFVERSDYDAMIFIGGRGVEEYLQDTDIMNMIMESFSDRILLCAIGRAVELFAYAGIISSRKVTCEPSMINVIEGAGGFYTGRVVEQDGEIITGIGVESAKEFAESIDSALEWRGQRKGPLK